VPLSEHEQRLLDQIERALYQDDPKFASTVRQTDLRTHMKRRLVKAGLVLTVGFGLLLTGVVISQPLVGIAGFGVMVLALLLAMTAWKRMGQGSSAPPLQAVDPRSGQHGRRPTVAPPAREVAVLRQRGGPARPARGALEAPWDERDR
jgi:hypothetical protein